MIKTIYFLKIFTCRKVCVCDSSDHRPKTVFSGRVFDYSFIMSYYCLKILKKKNLSRSLLKET